MACQYDSQGEGKSNNGTESRVLIVHDRSRLRDALVGALKASGFAARTAASGAETLRQLTLWQPTLLLIDLFISEGTGLAICRKVSGLDPVPIIVLAPVDATAPLLEALEFGAVDYATRPLDGRALISRIRTALALDSQRNQLDADDFIEVGPLSIDPTRRRVLVRGVDVHFAKMEYEVLLALALRAGELRTTDEVLEEIWRGRIYHDPRTLNTHVRRIRQKLELDPSHPDHLLTVRGVGYYFNPTAAARESH